LTDYAIIIINRYKISYRDEMKRILWLFITGIVLVSRINSYGLVNIGPTHPSELKISEYGPCDENGDKKIVPPFLESVEGDLEEGLPPQTPSEPEPTVQSVGDWESVNPEIGGGKDPDTGSSSDVKPPEPKVTAQSLSGVQEGNTVSGTTIENRSASQDLQQGSKSPNYVRLSPEGAHTIPYEIPPDNPGDGIKPASSVSKVSTQSIPFQTPGRRGNGRGDGRMVNPVGRIVPGARASRNTHPEDRLLGPARDVEVAPGEFGVSRNTPPGGRVNSGIKNLSMPSLLSKGNGSVSSYNSNKYGETPQVNGLTPKVPLQAQALNKIDIPSPELYDISPQNSPRMMGIVKNGIQALQSLPPGDRRSQVVNLLISTVTSEMGKRGEFNPKGTGYGSVRSPGGYENIGQIDLEQEYRSSILINDFISTVKIFANLESIGSLEREFRKATKNSWKFYTPRDIIREIWEKIQSRDSDTRFKIKLVIPDSQSWVNKLIILLFAIMIFSLTVGYVLGRSYGILRRPSFSYQIREFL
jgi:hypothetical protein